MSLKLSKAVNLLRKNLILRPNLVRNLSLTPQNNRLFGRSSPPTVYNDTFFDLASNLMRSLEREFDFARRQFDRPMAFPTLLPSIFSRTQTSDEMITVDKDGNRKLQLAFDLSDFEPEEIHVKTHGHTLKVSAKKEKKSDTDYYLKEYSQSYSLPKELKLEDLKSKFSENGILTIEAQLPKEIESKKSKEREIPIEHGQTETKNISEGAEAAGKVASKLGGPDQPKS